MYADEAATVIENHDTSKTDEPLFLYFPMQSVHGPLQSSSACESAFDGIITDANRKTMAGMIKCMDDAVGVVIPLCLFAAFEIALIFVFSFTLTVCLPLLRSKV